jgi:vanillate O-demethylase monooxygenase subunit
MWTEVEWFPCGVMLLHTGAAPVGHRPEQGFDTMNAHIMTPESSMTTHYFYCNSRNYLVDDAEYNARMAVGLRYAFECEDKPMIEAQQQRIGEIDLFEQHPALLAVDVASTKARRMFERLLASDARTN